jgi:DNA replication protein DnaC
MIQQTQERFKELRLPAMEQEYRRQWDLPVTESLGFDERLALLVEAEWTARQNKKLSRLFKAASLRENSACLEELDYAACRNVDKATVARLADCSGL